MLIRTTCPLGGPPEEDEEVYTANFDASALDPTVFSARRRPDRLHYRMVRNRRTKLLRADPILDSETLQAMYRNSSVTYDEIAGFAADTYLEYAETAWPHLPDKRGVLEIGCGNGFTLQRLAAAGFEDYAGIEPSTEARARASAAMRSRIRGEPLHKGQFPSQKFSLIAGFQVLDHIADPIEVLEICNEVLVPGGIMYWICHDIRSPLARILGERCPMIDIEHTVLYDRSTLRQLFEMCGYEVIDVFGVSNTYPLSYWLHLAPLPTWLKKPLLELIRKTSARSLRIRVNFGNMGIIARKPTTGAAT